MDDLYNRKILQNFKGEIGGIIIENENIYYSMDYILENIENKFGKCYNQEFIKDLYTNIENIRLKYDEFSFDKLENDFNYSIREAKNFSEIKFNYYNNDSMLDNFNESIKNNKYLKLEDLKNESEKLKLEYEQKKNEILSNVGQEMLNYTTYQTNELISKKNMDIAKENYTIYAKKYELGTDTYENYVEKRNAYNKAVIDYEVAKNELAAYTKKIKYYK